MKICTVKNCESNATYKIGYCPKHYQRNKVHGDPLIEVPRGTRHGLKKHPLYSIWKGIKSRCYNPRTKAYKNYGGRGIKICDEWMDPGEFIKYAEGLEGYAARGIGANGTTLDRINNDSGYEPGNIRWTDRKTQRANQRAAHDV